MVYKANVEQGFFSFLWFFREKCLKHIHIGWIFVNRIYIVLSNDAHLIIWFENGLKMVFWMETKYNKYFSMCYTTPNILTIHGIYYFTKWFFNVENSTSWKLGCFLCLVYYLHMYCKLKYNFDFFQILQECRYFLSTEWWALLLNFENQTFRLHTYDTISNP